MVTKPSPTLTLTADEIVFLEEVLQRDAVEMIRSSDNVADTLASPVYRENRELFGKVWDALLPQVQTD